MAKNSQEIPVITDRNLALEAVRVTEAAALAASRLMGRGDEKAADQAAVDAMRTALNRLAIDGEVVIGEGDGNFGARVVGRDLAFGTERWSVPAPASFEAGVTPGAAGDDVAVCDHFGTITLVDSRRGATRWQTALRAPILDTRVVLTPHAVVLRTYGGKIVVLDRGSGRLVRRLDPGGFPVGFGVGRGRLVFAVRLARPDRVESERLR